MNSPSPTPEDAIEFLKADHREGEQLFSQFQSAKGRQQRKKMIEKIAVALTAHAILEEEIFYAACREEGVEEDELDVAQVEHDAVKLLVSDLLKSSQDDDYYDAKVTVLGEYVKHHVGEEEKADDGIFARARKAGIDMAELGRKLRERKDELMADKQRLLGRPPRIRSLNLSQLNQDYGDMARYPSDRYREDESRYGGYRSMGSRYRGDYDDDYREPGMSRASRSDAYGYDDDYGPTRGDYGQGGAGGGDHGRFQGGSGDERRPGGHRGIERSAGGGRYRPYYDDDYARPSAGRYLGPGGEDREYYHGTRYGSSYGGGRYRSEDEDDERPGRDRYSGGPDYGGRGGYRGNR